MRRIPILCAIVALFAAAAAAPVTLAAPTAGTSPDAEPFTLKRFTVKLRKGGDREIVVPVPDSVRYKNRYFRGYVAAYITEWNAALWQASQPWANDRTAVGVSNYALYNDQKLIAVRDLDTVAKDDAVDTQYMVRHGPREDHFRTAAQRVVQQDIKLLTAKERKK